MTKLHGLFVGPGGRKALLHMHVVCGVWCLLPGVSVEAPRTGVGSGGLVGEAQHGDVRIGEQMDSRVWLVLGVSLPS